MKSQAKDQNITISDKEGAIKEVVSASMYSALKNSLYPGAKDESIAMVLAYCKSRGLDPLQKPVHIVPMWVKDSSTGDAGMRDIVMPGIGLYRIQAQRSGQYAGQTEPEFGEDVTERIGNIAVTYPKWCKVTIKKQLPDGKIVEFPSMEFWKENYATKGKEETPNAMWAKRPYAQLAKCTEAQALRKAFPDVIDQSPAAEEMEGKSFDGDIYDSNIHIKDTSNIGPKISQTEDEKIETMVSAMQSCKNLDELKASYTSAYKWAKKEAPHLLDSVIIVYDDKKLELTKEIEDFAKALD